jgi:hypothetical protein
MENFLNEYYGGDHKTGVLNEEKAKQDFRARISKNKDKRFKKQAEITAGEQAEIERIKKYKTAFDEFNAYLGAGVVSFTKVEREIGNDIQVSGNYALNICPDENKNPKLKDYVSYVTEKVNADGVKLNVATAQDMHVTFFRFRDVEESFEFEAVLYLNDLIKTCLAGASVA